MVDLPLESFPLKTFDKIRYADTDRQGHVNNAVFSSFLETGRVELLYNDVYPILNKDSSFVIASLQLDFMNEIQWPGNVNIGTGLLRVGNSSMLIYQRLFQNELCVAQAKTTIVQIHNIKKKSHPLSEEAKNSLSNWLLNT